jgi:transcriptional regulator with XRE-family HTH domain
MKNLILAQKIKELRLSAGSSQEELAGKTQLSLRTIQRIENGETQPRGDSLKRFALALGITIEELTDLPDPDESGQENRSLEYEDDFRGRRNRQGVESIRENKGFLTVLHLSALSFLIFPVLGVLVPLILWILKKDEIKDVAATGKKILNFQISWFLVFFIIYGNASLAKILHMRLFPDGITIFRLLAAMYIYNVITVIINIVRQGKNQAIVYKPAIPFMPAVGQAPNSEGR